MIFAFLVAGIYSCSAGVVPAAVAPAAIAYSRAVPYSVPPHVSRIDINTKALAAPIIAAAPVVAATGPIVAPAAPIVAPAAAPFLSGYPVPAAVSAPFLSAAGFIQPAYAGSLVAPFAPAYGTTILG